MNILNSEVNAMTVSIEHPAQSKARLWTGRALTTIVVLFLIIDIVFKFIRPIPPQVMQSISQLGFQPNILTITGILLLACTLLYVLPATSVLGAMLLTGYLGGAVSVHVRVGNPLFGYILFPVYIGILLWTGLCLREPRLLALLPLRK
jgi:predicted Abi (CAAX) family protease